MGQTSVRDAAHTRRAGGLGVASESDQQHQHQPLMGVACRGPPQTPPSRTERAMAMCILLSFLFIVGTAAQVAVSSASFPIAASHELLIPPVPGAAGFALSQSSTCCGGTEEVSNAYAGDICIGSHQWDGWTSGFGPFMCSADGSTPSDVTCAGAATSTLASGENLVGEWIQFCGSTVYTFNRFYMLPMGREMRLPSSLALLGSNSPSGPWRVASFHRYRLCDDPTCTLVEFTRNTTEPDAAFSCFRTVVLEKCRGYDDAWISLGAIQVAAIVGSLSPSSASTSSPSSSTTSTFTASPTGTPSSGLACPPALFRALPRMDLVGSPLTDAPLTAATEGACRIACCGAPGCDGYAFAFTELRFGNASCVLLANVTSSAPNNFAASGMREGVAFMLPSSASPTQTPIFMSGSSRRGPSTTATPTLAFSPQSTRSVSSISGSSSSTTLDTAERRGCTISADVGKVSCWGRNDDGMNDSPPLAARRGQVAVAAASQATCSISATNNLTCWGWDPYGTQFPPEGVLRTGQAAVSLGHVHGCALSLAGSVVCWGSYTTSNTQTPAAAQEHQVAIATGIFLTVSLSDTGRVTCFDPGCFVPSWATTGQVGIFAGGYQSCALSDIGGVGCWAPGSPNGIDVSFSPPPPSWAASGQRAIGVGFLFTCALSVIGAIGCWGATSATTVPLSVQSGQVALTAWNSACALSATGSATCWGDDSQANSIPTSYASGIALPAGFTFTPTPTMTPSATSLFYCDPSIFRSLSRMDLVGTLVGTALAPGLPVSLFSEVFCRQACCDAAFCDGYAFATGDVSFVNGGPASCFLYVNITQLIPNSAFSSGIYESTL